MTDQETTVETVEAFNPYDSSEPDTYYTARAWDAGKAKLLLVIADGTTTDNPYHETDQPDRFRSWDEGYRGIGISGDAFDHPLPTEDNGIFLMPDVATLDWAGTRRAHAVTAWCYEAQADKQDPKVRPQWANFPLSARCIRIADGHAWAAAMRWMSNAEIRGHKTYQLPCPPYEYELDGTTLTIRAGFVSTGGNKADWQSVLETMQAEVDEMPDGFFIGDDYLNVTLVARVSGSISISAVGLLSGHDQMDEDQWTGDPDDYHEAVNDALDGYDYSYEVSDMEIDMDYVDWEIEDTDSSDLSDG